MSAEILKNKETILECSSVTFDIMYLNFLEIVEKNPLLGNNTEIKKFMNYMEMYNYQGGSYWFDITNYITSSESAELLINILEQTIVKIQHSISKNAIMSLWSFYEELVKYRDELKARGQ